MTSKLKALGGVIDGNLGSKEYPGIRKGKGMYHNSSYIQRICTMSVANT